MALVFWSDPHLGLNRTSHTTPQSRKALRDKLYQQALNVTQGNDTYICLGDLFDTTENDEATIAEGAAVAARCSLVLSGNHDLPNRDGRLSSLQLIGELNDKAAVALDDDSQNHFRLSFPEAYVVAVPHKRTQELFDASLHELRDYSSAKDRPSILVLHCNYNSGYAHDDATLNLTRDQAEHLLTRFDYILIGHEHIARSDFDGRLQLLGNVHPTSFSDISDKFVWRFDSEGLQPMQVWDAYRYTILDWETLLLVNIPYPEQADLNPFHDKQFIEITGTCPAARLPEVSKAVQKLWSQAHDALMIRNNVKAEAIEIAEAPQMQKALDIPSKISAELQGTKLEGLWNSYLSKI